MDRVNLTGIAIGWFASGILALGYWCAAMKAKWPAIWGGQREVWANFDKVLFGPVALFVVFLMGNCRYGWLIWDKSDEPR